MTTGLDIVTKALQKNGVLQAGETPTSNEASDGLYSLNAMLSSWANDSMLVNALTSESFTLTAGVSEYTIGTGQTFNTARPMFINEAHVRRDITDYPVQIITAEAFALIPQKDTRGRPEVMTYDNGYPKARITLWFVPDYGYTLYLKSEKPLTSFTLAGDVTLPPGWERALIHNLAIEIAPDYGEATDPKALALCERIATESKAAIRTAIMRNRPIDAPPVQSLGINALLNRGL